VTINLEPSEQGTDAGSLLESLEELSNALDINAFELELLGMLETEEIRDILAVSIF